MKAVDLNYFLDLGSALQEASSVDPKGGLFDAYFRLIRLNGSLRTLSSGQLARLSATAHDLTELQTALTAFENRHFRDAEGKWRTPEASERSEFELSTIVNKVSQFRTVLTADLRIASAFSVLHAGIFDVNLLVNSAHKALGADAIKRVSVEALTELDASGKCLAFDLPTAAGFHAMRAVERVIKSYLTIFFVPKDIDNMHNWGAYISSLEKVAASDASRKPSDEAIALIRQIKDIYRNPVIHPDRVLSAEEATTLFHSTLAAINRIAGEMEEEQSVFTGLLGGLLGRGAGAAALIG